MAQTGASVIRWLEEAEYAAEREILPTIDPDWSPPRGVAEKLTAWIIIWRICNDSADAVRSLRRAGFRVLV